MSERMQRVVITILDKEFQVACAPDERQALLSAARELDSRMRRVRNSGSVIGMDRIAVMVALNLCHELQEARSKTESTAPDQALAQLARKLDAALQD